MSGEVVYGSLPADYCLAAKCAGLGGALYGFHRVAYIPSGIDNDVTIHVDENADDRFEEERAMSAFGVADEELLRSKGIPVVSLEFV